MAKKKNSTRVNTIDTQGWGSTSQVIAPEAPAPDPIVLPSPEQAIEVLQRLAECNARVITAKARYEEAATTAKQRKGKWEQVSEELSNLLRDATRGSSTPLLDAAQGEEDLRRMEQAIANGGAEGAGVAQGEISPEGGTEGQAGEGEALNGPETASDGESGNVLEFPAVLPDGVEVAPVELF